MCVARNPKDCIVSQYHFLRAFPSIRFTGTLEDMAQAFFDDRCLYAPFYDNVAGYWQRRHQPNIFFTTYEHMLRVQWEDFPKQEQSPTANKLFVFPAM